MNRWVSFGLALAVTGCGASRVPADVMAELRQIRAEQQRQARQIELLENRLVLAEDSARQARQAVLSGSWRSVVRIDSEGGEPSETPSPAADTASQENEQGEEQAGSDEQGPRPLVRASGRETAPGMGPQTPIVVREGDRIPVAPLHPVPSQGTTPRRARGATPNERTIPAPDEGPGSSTPGVSSVRDPRSTQAYENALALARAGRCGESIDAMSAFLVRWPDHPYVENAMYWRGECMLARGDARRAAHEFEGLLARFPEGRKAPDALYKLVICYRTLGDSARAQEYGERLLREFSESDAAARLRAEGNP